MRGKYAGNLSATFYVLVLCCIVNTSAFLVHADYQYPLDIFTNNGLFSDSSDLNFYVDVSIGQGGTVDFTFHNESLVYSSIARIYFDDDSLLDIININNGPGTSFSLLPSPHHLPSSGSLDPPFITNPALSCGSETPRPHSGINPGEWLQLIFNLNTGTFSDVIDQLDTADIRIGVHIIALPDGSSESAVTVPEPATVCILGVGSLVFLRRKGASIK